MKLIKNVLHDLFISNNDFYCYLEFKIFIAFKNVVRFALISTLNAVKNTKYFNTALINSQSLPVRKNIFL